MVIKAVVFDFDDCLIRNFDFSSHELVEAAKAWNRQREPKLDIPDINIFARHYYGSWEEWIGRLWPVLGGRVDEFKSLCKEVPYRARPAMPGAFRVLGMLKRRGLVTGILTNREGESLQRRIKESRIDAFGFDFVHSAADHGLRKPDGKAFDSAIVELAKKGIKPEEALYVGDQIDDMASKKSGIKFVAVCSGVVGRDNFLENGVNRRDIITSINELPRYMGLGR